MNEKAKYYMISLMCSIEKSNKKEMSVSNDGTLGSGLENWECQIKRGDVGGKNGVTNWK